MVKKAISGKGRRGAPPLPRQRGALRVVQVTLLALGAFSGVLAYNSYQTASAATEVAVLGLLTALFGGGSLWMGIRVVRGPQPPQLD